MSTCNAYTKFEISVGGILRDLRLNSRRSTKIQGYVKKSVYELICMHYMYLDKATAITEHLN